MVQAKKRKKNVGMRGSRTHGCGSHKKRRGGGSRGGRGMAGVKRHKKTWMLKHKPGHLGKRGFKSMAQRKLTAGKKAVNVRDLAGLAAGNRELDLKKLGYDRVLGGGSINVAISVRADYFTETAKQKIEKAKGRAVPVSDKNEEIAQESGDG